MAASGRTEDEVNVALAMAEREGLSAAERAEMLMEMGTGLQKKPKSPADIEGAITLYRRGLDLAPVTDPLLAARIRARLATALMALPAQGRDSLAEAREAIELALATLVARGGGAEIAEAEMNLGLILQTLAAAGHARIQDAISAYQRALRTFDRAAYPQEFAILQNNLATAFLSVPFTSESAKMREALAVQCFEQGLEVVTLIDHPAEYAMLQNNLGNALQAVTTTHPWENRLRALEAYDEALKVRTIEAMPEEYANTIANKAFCLANLPDDPEAPEAGNDGNMARAVALLTEARRIFVARGSADKAGQVAEVVADWTGARPADDDGDMPVWGEGPHTRYMNGSA